MLKGSLDVSEMAQELSALLQEIFEDEMMELMRRASDPIAQLSRVAEQVTPSRNSPATWSRSRSDAIHAQPSDHSRWGLARRLCGTWYRL